MVVVYPVLLKEYSGEYLIYVPDLDIYTQGENLANAIFMARDAIGTLCLSFEDKHEKIPVASTEEEARRKAGEAKDEEVDFSDGICSLVDCDLLALREKVDKRSVRKNVSIPAWMSFRAEQEHLNLSQVLQEALRDKFS